MIQRIQSIYLALTFLISLVFLKGSYLVFNDNSGNVIKVTLDGIAYGTGMTADKIINTLALNIVLLFLPLISLTTLLLFKRRVIQLIFNKIGIISEVLLIILLIYFAYLISSEFSAMLIFKWKLILPVIMLICSIMAYRGIRKDEMLIKSYDRLR